jgi:hypothetical protein
MRPTAAVAVVVVDRVSDDRRIDNIARDDEVRAQVRVAAEDRRPDLAVAERVVVRSVVHVDVACVHVLEDDVVDAR